jgi:hypothetical protein
MRSDSLTPSSQLLSLTQNYLVRVIDTGSWFRGAAQLPGTHITYLSLATGSSEFAVAVAFVGYRASGHGKGTRSSATDLEPRPQDDRGATSSAARELRRRVWGLIDLDRNDFTAGHEMVDVARLQFRELHVVQVVLDA